jgi:hypothetical protein
MARWKRLDVSAEVLSGLLQGTSAWTTYRIKNGIPPGAELAEVTYHRREQVVSFVYMHQGFPDVAVAVEIPPIYAMVETMHGRCPDCEKDCGCTP